MMKTQNTQGIILSTPITRYSFFFGVLRFDGTDDVV